MGFNPFTLGQGSPQVAQGTLNRIRASLQVPQFAQLNVTSSYLGKGGITLAFEGEAVTLIGTMTGTVISEEPYVMAAATVHLLKTQYLAALYKAQVETQAAVGDVTVIPDAASLPQYQLTNCAISAPRELNFAGEDADYVVMIRGYYQTNSGLFSGN